MADTYDFWAGRITGEERAAVGLFWEVFQQSADALDKTFRQQGEVDVGAIMQEALGPYSNCLFWEFGPGVEDSHHLALSPELHHELRPLARAFVNGAPDLPGWSFSDARPADDLDQHTVSLIEGRAQMAFPLTGAEASRGEHRRIDLTGTGSGSEDTVAGMAGLAFSVLFGEAVERDWLGELHARRRGMIASLKKAPDPQDWLPGFVEQTRAVLGGLMETRPDERLGEGFDLDGPVSLFQVEPKDNPHNPRADMFTYNTQLADLAQARFQGARLSVLRFSRHAESLCGLRIPRTEDHPFDQVDDRGVLEDAIHAALASDGNGGVTGAGHGKAHVYIDFATNDIPAAMARVEAELGRAGINAPCDLLFDEAGLEERTLPLSPAGHAH